MGHFNDTHYCSKCDIQTNAISWVKSEWLCDRCKKVADKVVKQQKCKGSCNFEFSGKYESSRFYTCVNCKTVISYNE